MARWQLSVLAAVVLLAGCGGDSGSSASEDYANDVCSSLSTWVTEVNGAIMTLTDAGLATDREDVQFSVEQVTEATDDLLNSLEELGPPDTDAGQEAKSELASLATTLRQQVEGVEQALEAEASPTALAATVTAALATAASAVESSFNMLRDLDPGGELEDGFENGEDCKSLRDQVAAIGS